MDCGNAIESLGGYRDDYLIMEEYDFMKRTQENYRFGIIPKSVVVSARKYDTNSYFQVQMTNFTIMQMWHRGKSQKAMVEKYKVMLHYGR